MTRAEFRVYHVVRFYYVTATKYCNRFTRVKFFNDNFVEDIFNEIVIFSANFLTFFRCDFNMYIIY